ncbi:hypothetical protein WMW72_09120 [Paenibacillus filicis]|uniref:DUF5666 domain-containing protein n=1 Tax=Paenibacillus filicis TaxID=669464 RepID=A0ABU9DGR6_9BACL
MNPVVRIYALWLLLLVLLVVSVLPLSIQNSVARSVEAAFQQVLGFSQAAIAAVPERPVREAEVYPPVSVLEARHMLEQPVSVEGIVISEPVLSQDGQRRSLRLHDATGEIVVAAEQLEGIRPGDRLRVNGFVGDTRGELEVRARTGGLLRLASVGGQ